MNNIVEQYIQKKIPYDEIPKQIQNSELTRREYEKLILAYSISNQLEYSGNLVQFIKDKNIKLSEKKYHEELIKYSKENLMLYPYHLSKMIVRGLDITPFQYYYSMLENIMEHERSYDSLPNFTAADCLRLMGIGRNEYIELMNKFRSTSKLFSRKKRIKSLLPTKPVEINIEPWWYVESCDIFEEDMRTVTDEEKALIDHIIDSEMDNKKSKQRAGDLDYKLVTSLYTKGFIYLEVPIHEDDHVVLPPLEGFVMNRVLGDYIENLLYKIFVSIDERTSVGELASVLQIDLQLVKNVVSLYCRLGFAIKKVPEFTDLHPSWEKRVPVKAKNTISMSNVSSIAPSLQLDIANATADVKSNTLPVSTPCEEYCGPLALSPSKGKRMAFLFDSTLTAFLMMGNLSPGLRSHAVTMFEVGKLSDESLESFLTELEKVSTVRDDSEGEAKRYFEHALILRETILTLRYHENNCSPLDLVRCESLESLDKETASRLLNKNYSLLVSMAPLCKEVTPITSINPPHLGPAHSEINTFWFKLFLYHIIGIGPPSILFVKGTRLRRLPQMLHNCCKLLVTSWGHDPMVVPIHNCLFTINDALLYAPVLVQTNL
ncbi:protein FAM91A1 [Diaphorina citri]|uniref:Protein FAM91A1 n=1 Tax=Diaphorina citri TaxID=121845 RepID=A0A3Q0IMV8_DIACI|nr:protein FAM91A1 [Diaphorina citri]